MECIIIFVRIDIKPSNILVNTLGHVKLCDFGVSVQVSCYNNSMGQPVENSITAGHLNDKDLYRLKCIHGGQLRYVVVLILTRVCDIVIA